MRLGDGALPSGLAALARGGSLTSPGIDEQSPVLARCRGPSMEKAEPARDTAVMKSRDDEDRPGLADAAGRAAFFPARAAARVWRGPIEEAVDEVLSAPEIARVVDRALAGSLPEEIARSLVRHRVARAHRRRTRCQWRVGASHDRRSREPADTRAHRQSPGERRDATRHGPRRLEPRAPGGDHAADDGACRRGDRRRPCLRDAARRPSRARRAPARAGRAPDLRRDRDARDRARDRRGPDDRPCHVGGRGRRADRVARRRPSPGVARRRPARVRLAAGRRHVLRPLLERGGADAGDAAAARARSRSRGQASFPRSIHRAARRPGARDRAALCRLHPGAVHEGTTRPTGLPGGNRRRVRRRCPSCGPERRARVRRRRCGRGA